MRCPRKPWWARSSASPPRPSRRRNEEFFVTRAVFPNPRPRGPAGDGGASQNRRHGGMVPLRLVPCRIRHVSRAHKLGVAGGLVMDSLMSREAGFMRIKILALGLAMVAMLGATNCSNDEQKVTAAPPAPAAPAEPVKTRFPARPHSSSADHARNPDRAFGGKLGGVARSGGRHCDPNRLSIRIAGCRKARF